ncbi:acyl carrier protein [Litorimonas taeanensis]|uniref:Acyl carrier protein n=1 Tax=Litorimonas taeanensis TaxID=568099 RepID=A0A420WKR3_9PROT|nr:phosphopantetheine-binding protein [Litorimonas taeanensis]RKQ71559.1 acyl carrier protein [Litorimonas taeanensis]
MSTSPSRDEIFDKICELLKPYNPQNREILKESGIMSDLEVDSVAVFDLVMGLEDHYDISIPMEMVSDIKTVGELVNAVKELTSE